jgi:hypothetical protein
VPVPKSKVKGQKSKLFHFHLLTFDLSRRLAVAARAAADNVAGEAGAHAALSALAAALLHASHELRVARYD